MVGMWQDGVDAGPHFLRVISIDLRLVTNSDVKHQFVGIPSLLWLYRQCLIRKKIGTIIADFLSNFFYPILSNCKNGAQKIKL